MANPTINGTIRFTDGKYTSMKLCDKDFPDFAWDIYNFVNEYKKGNFGETSLGKAMNEHFVNFQQNYLKEAK